MRPAVFEHPTFADHELLDSGGAEKLERFGELVLRRPDPQALWRPRLSPEEWSDRADLIFVRESDRGGRWEARRGGHPIARRSEPRWPVRFCDATFVIRPTPFKHVGLFPEQAANWVWIRRARDAFAGECPRLLNLFGYTGAASVIAAQAGYGPTHVDASRVSIAWARENAQASGLPPDGIRILVDDALGFARREERRCRRYEGILIDPPHHGRGPKGESWQFEDHLAELIDACRGLLAERSFLILSAYAIGFPPLSLANVLAELGGGEIESGELALPETGPSPRLLSCGVCARWSRGIDLGPG